MPFDNTGPNEPDKKAPKAASDEAAQKPVSGSNAEAGEGGAEKPPCKKGHADKAGCEVSKKKKFWRETKRRAKVGLGWTLIAASFILPPPIPAGMVGTYLVATESEAGRRMVARFRRKYPEKTDRALESMSRVFPGMVKKLRKLTDPDTVLGPEEKNSEAEDKKDNNDSGGKGPGPKMERVWRRALRVLPDRDEKPAGPDAEKGRPPPDSGKKNEFYHRPRF